MGTCSYLPEDFLRDILLRLPVKPLVRFRLVCKSWSALLKSRDFTTTHLNRSANHGCHLLVYSHGPEGHTMSLISSEALDDVAAAKIETPTQGGMVGCCNGLVCLHNGWRNIITLWNPATREIHKILSKFPVMLIRGRAVGFGYHLNDYKVVMVEYSMDVYPVPVTVKVYSTSTGSWRVVDDANVPCSFIKDNCSVILKGVPYWLGFVGMTGEKELVVSFDMGKEVFRQVQMPPDAEASYYNYSKKLVELNESLAIVYYRDHPGQDGNFIEFGVMKDDGVNECWSKVQRIEPFPIIGFLLGCWKDRVVLLKYGLLLYDPNTKAVNQISTFGAPQFIHTSSISTYTESLVSVNRG